MSSALNSNKHQLKTEATRRKLLKSARRIFSRDGFEAARIEDIAGEAGHTRGAFYAIFTGKEDVFFALLEEQTGEHVNKLRQLLETCPTPEERLPAIREYYARRLVDRHWSMLMMEFKLFAIRHGNLRTKLLKRERAIRASLKKSALGSLLPEMVNRDDQTYQSIRKALEGTLHGLILEHAYDPRTMPEDQMERYLHQIFDVLTEDYTGSCR